MNWMLIPFRRYFDFFGRSRRMEFWMWQLFLFGVGIVWWILFAIVFGAALWSLMSSYPGAFEPAYDRYDGGYRSQPPPDAVFAAFGIPGIVLFVLSGIWTLVTFIPNLAVTIRRLHDTNRTGWWCMAPVVPYLIATLFAMAAPMSQEMAVMAAIVTLVALLAMFGLFVVVIVFLFMDGTRGPNRFGPDPKVGSYEQTFR